MNPRDELNGSDPCDALVVGPLGNARERLRALLTTEAETLVSILGWVEVAMESSLEPNQRRNVREHCRQALNLVSAIQRRNPDGNLPPPVAACVLGVREDLTRALQRLDPS